MKSLFIIIISSVGLLATSKAQTSTIDTFAQKATAYMDKATYNPVMAFNYYMHSAALGNAKSMNAVGVCYQQGIGIAPNKQNAIVWFTKAAIAGYAKGWYNIAMVHDENRNFDSCYYYLSKAKALGDDYSGYYMAYMQYKGLGCPQNYASAAKAFIQGTHKYTFCMYYYGLCLRNGYGVSKNIDSARYWLIKASSEGYADADLELMSKEAENNNSPATALAQKIKDAKAAMPAISINKYRRVTNKVDLDDLAGTYNGYLLKYDWSGKNIVEANKLNVTLNFSGDSLGGTWTEDDSVTISVHAKPTANYISFSQMEYSKINHYSSIPELTVFKKANLQLDKIGDSVYVSGNINQFIPDRNEPSKPMYVALVRSKAVTTNKLSSVDDIHLQAYPNPFTSTLTIYFELKESGIVSTQLLTMDGKVVYNNPAGALSTGKYSLPIQPQKLASGYYTLVVRYGNKTKTTKVIKL